MADMLVADRLSQNPFATRGPSTASQTYLARAAIKAVCSRAEYSDGKRASSSNGCFGKGISPIRLSAGDDGASLTELLQASLCSIWWLACSFFSYSQGGRYFCVAPGSEMLNELTGTIHYQASHVS